MRWTPGGPSRNVEDRRGQGGGMFGRGMAPLGIGGTIVLLVLGLIFGKDFTGGSDSGLPQSQTASGEVGPIQQSPEEERLAQFVNFVVDDIQGAWKKILPGYQETKLVLYRDVTPTACGMGESAAGPFYCPNDQEVYIDLGFYDELRNRFGASGEFAEAYVIAHEFGHHVQHLLGTDVQLRRTTGSETAKSVQLELQADCYAGVWGYTAQQRGKIEPGEMEEGLKAASAIGDDNIQRQTTGVVRPESFTHGSAVQRTGALRRGLTSGDGRRCEIGTF